MTQGETWKRLGYAVVALVLLGGIVIFQGLPQGPVLLTIFVIGVVFACLSGVLAALRLWRHRR